MADPFAPRSMKRKNVKGLALKAAAPRPPPTAETNRHEFNSGSQDAGKDEQLEIGIEYKLDLRPEDLEIVKELGSGNGGTVSKVRHLTTGTVMARKVSSPPRPQLCKTLMVSGHSCRSQARDTEANRSRTPDYAWMPLRLHRYILRCLFESQQRCYYVHGIHGRWVSMV